MKKLIILISVALAAVVAGTSVFLFAGCGEQDYPLEIAGCKLDREPENVIVLDPATADIMAFMSYDRRFAGRSDSVTQPELAFAPSVGTESEPNINAIRGLKPDFVFCNEKLSDEAAAELNSYNIPFVKLQTPNTPAEVKANYITIGKILSGKNKGSQLGKESYANLTAMLDAQKSEIEELSGTGKLDTVCYLYLGENGLTGIKGSNYGNILMGYTNCVNIFSVGNNDTSVSPADDTAKTVISSDPDYIFYDTEETLKAIGAIPGAKKLHAVKNKKLCQIPFEDMCRPGITAPRTVAAMIDFIYGDRKATPDQADATVSSKEAVKSKDKNKEEKPAATKAAETKPAATAPAAEEQAQENEAPADQDAQEEDLSAKYGINLSGLSLSKDQENGNVKIMQQRLSDLGYIKPQGNDTNITGYYGNVTEAAVKAFQKASGIKETGAADNKTLTAMFKSTAAVSK